MCEYYRTVSVTFLIANVSVANFNADVGNVRTNFISSVASAAGVDTSSVTIVSVTATRRRRLLSGDTEEEIVELSIVARIDPHPNIPGLEQHEHYVEHTIEKK